MELLIWDVGWAGADWVNSGRTGTDGGQTGTDWVNSGRTRAGMDGGRTGAVGGRTGSGMDDG